MSKIDTFRQVLESKHIGFSPESYYVNSLIISKDSDDECISSVSALFSEEEEFEGYLFHIRESLMQEIPLNDLRAALGEDYEEKERGVLLYEIQSGCEDDAQQEANWILANESIYKDRLKNILNSMSSTRIINPDPVDRFKTSPSKMYKITAGEYLRVFSGPLPEPFYENMMIVEESNRIKHAKCYYAYRTKKEGDLVIKYYIKKDYELGEHDEIEELRGVQCDFSRLIKNLYRTSIQGENIKGEPVVHKDEESRDY